MWATATRISTMTTTFGKTNALRTSVRRCLTLLSRRKVGRANVKGLLRDPINQNQCKNFFSQSNQIISFPSLSVAVVVVARAHQSCPISAFARTWTPRSGTGRTIVKTAAENAYLRWSFQTRWCNARARVTQRCLVKSAPRNGSNANVWMPRRNETMRQRVRRRRRRTSARRVGRRNRRRRSRERS